jgi:hypothetical protein
MEEWLTLNVTMKYRCIFISSSELIFQLTIRDHPEGP